MGCFRGDLQRDIRFYCGGIERKEDPRKYREFLTDRDRLVGEELLRCGILKSGLSTAWLNDLMEDWNKIYNQFIQVFSSNEIGIEGIKLTRANYNIEIILNH
ncbi:1316_t:CDS:1, partial [Entrophospora sp. SA101]